MNTQKNQLFKAKDKLTRTSKDIVNNKDVRKYKAGRLSITVTFENNVTERAIQNYNDIYNESADSWINRELATLNVHKSA